MIQVGVDVIKINVIQNYKTFAPNFFNFKIILMLNISFNAIVSRVFTFIFLCAMPRRAPVGEIRCRFVKEAEDPNVSWWDSVTTILSDIAIPLYSSTTFHTVNMWHYASNGSPLFYRNAIICVPPKINTLFLQFF